MSNRPHAGSDAGPSRPRPTPSPLQLLLGCSLLMLTSGCTSFWPGKSGEDSEARFRELLTVPDPPDLIREAAVPHGLHPIAVQGVGVVNALAGTGGPADPSIYLDQLIEEMKRNDVQEPSSFLERDQTAMVRVETLIPPGAKRGDLLDLVVETPPRNQVTDLHGGWLMDTRLRHQQVIQNAVRQSEVLGIATGPVLTRANYEPATDKALKLEGRILSGAKVQEDRKLGLVLRPEYQHVKMAAGLAAAINQRFFFFDGTTRRGIANPTEDDFIEVDVHPRYRQNVHRMMRVIRAIGTGKRTADPQARLVELGKRLSEPATAADAALQLEGLGESAIPTLLEGIKSSNPELRFYAAEALAYLDRSEAIEPLEQAAREVPAFRHPALQALEGLEQHLAVDALKRLMDETSIETRYGAFCSIRRRTDGRSSLAGQPIGEACMLYRIPSATMPVVVASLRERAEIVVFGEVSPLQIKDFLFGPSGMIFKPAADQPGVIRISRFQPGREDQRAVVPSTVEGLVQGIVTVGGGYGDVVTVLRLAKTKGCLSDQFVIDPLPDPVRTYYRDQDGQKQDDSDRDGDSDDNAEAVDDAAKGPMMFET